MDENEDKKNLECKPDSKEDNCKPNGRKNFVEKFRENPWMISTLVLGILFIGFLFSGNGFTGSVITGGVVGVSSDVAIKNFEDFASVKGIDVSVNEVTEKYGLYQIDFSTDEGGESTAYISNDGKYFVNIQGIIPMIEEDSSSSSNPSSESKEIPKSDKPLVELFVMAFCPYGTQAEKGFLPVVNLLGDSIDSSIKFVDYAMHPTQGEVEENLREYCIQEEQEDKFNDYLECFLEGDGNLIDTNGDGVGDYMPNGNDPETCIEKVGVDKEKLDICYARVDEEFDIIKNLNDKSSWMSGRYPQFNIHKDLNNKYGVEGSPTLIINGVKSNAGRSPDAMLTAICSSFTEGNIPEECYSDLPSESYVPGFGWTLSSGATTNGAQCA